MSDSYNHDWVKPITDNSLGITVVIAIVLGIALGVWIG